MMATIASNATTTEELQKQIDAAQDGAIIEIPPIHLEGQIIIEKALTLKGAGPNKTVIDAANLGAAISVDAKYAEVRVEGIKITGGFGSEGGGLSITNGARVTVVGCSFEKNRASGFGGAIGLSRGALVVKDSTIIENEAIMGGAIYVGGDARAEISEVLLAWNVAKQNGGAMAFTDGAEVTVRSIRLESNGAGDDGQHVYVRGSSVRVPRIRLEQISYGAPNGDGPSVFNAPGFEGEILADASSWPRDSSSIPRHPPARLVE